MSDLLLHVPEGDHNPYVPLAWSRYPLEPFEDESFRVGVKTTQTYDSVVAEWEADDLLGETQLSLEDGAWSGALGPLAGACRYRFVGTQAGAETAHSDWFSLEIPRWEPLAFRSLEAVGTEVVAVGEGGQLRLTRAERSLAWSLEPSSQGASANRTAQLDDWDIMLDDGGRLSLERGQLRLVLWAEVARVVSEPRAWRLHWSLDSDERLLGTGERFDSLDQRGRRPDMRVYEQYKGQGSRTYFPLPWLISTRGYGLALDSAARSRFDLGLTDADVASVTVPTPAGASGRWYTGVPAALLEAYTADLGKRKTMPLWGYGPWMSSNEWNSQPRVQEVVERTLEEDIPATVMVIEAWADEATFYLWNDTQYESVDGAKPVPLAAMRHGGRWPDPKGLTDWLHEHGIRLVLWQIPVLKDMAEDEQMDPDHPQQTRDVAFADQAGFGVLAGDEPYRNRGWWFPRSRVIDFSNPAAAEWWFSKRAYLLDEMGIDGFKTDGGEHLWGGDIVAHDGATGDEAANRYPTQYLEAYHRFLEEHGDGDQMLFSRAGFTGSQVLPAHWAGDEDSTWKAYRASLTAGLSAGICGVAFWGWDIAGFSGPLPTSELYQRATAMAAFCPIMQYHSEHNGHRRPLADRTPWNVAERSGDPAAMAVYRSYAQLRMNLVPYLHGLGSVAAETGLPLMRAMALACPDDPVASALDDQYLLGPDLLVAPVLEPGTDERRVYLPAGEWCEFWTGEPVEAGWRTVPTPLESIPVFMRAGAAIPLWMPLDACELGARVGLPDADGGRMVLMVTPGNAESMVVEPRSGERRTVGVRRQGDDLSITSDGMPDGTLVWLRDPQGDQRRALSGGAAKMRLAGSRPGGQG